MNQHVIILYVNNISIPVLNIIMYQCISTVIVLLLLKSTKSNYRYASIAQELPTFNPKSPQTKRFDQSLATKNAGSGSTFFLILATSPALFPALDWHFKMYGTIQ